MVILGMEFIPITIPLTTLFWEYTGDWFSILGYQNPAAVVCRDTIQQQHTLGSFSSPPVFTRPANLNSTTNGDVEHNRKLATDSSTKISELLISI